MTDKTDNSIGEATHLLDAISPAASVTSLEANGESKNFPTIEVVDQGSSSIQNITQSDGLLDDILGVVAHKVQPKSAGQRPILAALIGELASRIRAKNKGAKLLVVPTGLRDARLGLNLKRANGFGDCLGKGEGGLRLPKIVKTGKPRYAPYLIDATDVVKSAFKTAFEEMTPKQHRAVSFA